MIILTNNFFKKKNVPLVGANTYLRFCESNDGPLHFFSQLKEFILK